jgi:hypothetical protein
MAELYCKNDYGTIERVLSLSANYLKSRAPGEGYVRSELDAKIDNTRNSWLNTSELTEEITTSKANGCRKWVWGQKE